MSSVPHDSRLSVHIKKSNIYIHFLGGEGRKSLSLDRGGAVCGNVFDFDLQPKAGTFYE